MYALRWLTAIAAATNVQLAPEAIAAPCAGFTDVDATSAFCPNVEWLKNRQVTLGCGATSYCPGDAVTRLAMAAFLNRVGVALTPTYIVAGDVVANEDLTVGSRACFTGDHVTASFPRIAVVDGGVSLFDSQTDQVVEAFAAYSTDGGKVWVSITGAPGSVRVSNVPDYDRATIPIVSDPLPLNAGLPYRFSIFVQAFEGTPGPASWLCGLRVRVENANGTSSPYDAASRVRIGR